VRVDPDLVDISRLDQDTRYRILMYVLREKKVTSTKLGYSSNYINRVKRRVLRVSDGVLRACLKFLSIEEYTRITGEEIEVVDVATVLRVLKYAL